MTSFLTLNSKIQLKSSNALIQMQTDHTPRPNHDPYSSKLVRPALVSDLQTQLVMKSWSKTTADTIQMYLVASQYSDARSSSLPSSLSLRLLLNIGLLLRWLTTCRGNNESLASTPCIDLRDLYGIQDAARLIFPAPLQTEVRKHTSAITGWCFGFIFFL